MLKYLRYNDIIQNINIVLLVFHNIKVVVNVQIIIFVYRNYKIKTMFKSKPESKACIINNAFVRHEQ